MVWQRFPFLLSLTACSLSLTFPKAVLASPPSYQYHRIHVAAREGNLEEVKKLIAEDRSLVNKHLGVTHWTTCKNRPENGLPVKWDETCTYWAECTPLYEAAGSKKLDVVRYLIENGADLRLGAREHPSCYPPHAAVNAGALDVVTYLLDHGADPNLRAGWRVRFGPYSEGAGSLHVAAQAGTIAIAKLLIERKASINMQDERGNTPLHMAVQEGHIPIVSLLVLSDADVAIKNIEGRTALDLALEIAKKAPLSIKSQWERIATILQVNLGKNTRATRVSLQDDLEKAAKLEPSESEADRWVRYVRESPNLDLIYAAKNLAERKDTRLIPLLEARLFDFDSFRTAEMAGLLRSFAFVDGMATAKRWLTIDVPPVPQHSLEPRDAGKEQDERYRRDSIFTVRWYAALFLLGGGEDDIKAGAAEADRLLSLYNDDLPYHARGSMPYAVDVLLQSKDAHAPELACRMAKLTDANRDHLELIKRLFLAGCEEALNHMLTQLIRTDLSGKASSTENGITRTSETCAADYFAEQLGNAQWRPARKEGNTESKEWYPPGFWYDRYEPVEEKIKKRDQLQAWLRKKFTELKERSDLKGK